jgi:hypothetical protein
MKRLILALVAVAVAVPCVWAAPAEAKTGTATPAVVEQRPIPDTWDWPDAMRKVAARFTGTQGVVLHIGDSITYANPYGAWARSGAGKTASDTQVLKWMHAGENNNLDGWYLAAFDVPDRGGSYTAVSGMRLDQALAGGFHGLPPMSEIIKKYNPQVVILMLGTNDASASRPVAAYKADLEKAVNLILANNTILVLSTIPPHCNKPELAREYNKVIIETARKYKLPLIDYGGEILARRPDDWNGTLLGKNDVHPTASAGDVNAGSAPTPVNLGKVGYLLRGWLSVQKIKDVKARAIDPAGKPAAGEK